MTPRSFHQGWLTAALLAMLAGPAIAADQTRTQDQPRSLDQRQIRDQDIYGHSLMTVQERNVYRSKMRAAKTAEERERIRVDHHEQMKVRAKERGVDLPDEPPAGRGPGTGGMGPGGRRY